MYETLSDKASFAIKKAQEKKYLSPFAVKDDFSVRRNLKTHDDTDVLRTPFSRDADKIINCPYFARYADKTQVFSLVKNDDVTRRSLHVQLVAKIAKTIGRALSLNTDLIESIALGHDIGHTPFGHAGERVLNEIYRKRTGRIFAHNLHSVRVLDKIFNYNITLQTLDGILTHDGELPRRELSVIPINDFCEFDKRIEKCYTEGGFVKTLSPSTLEAAVVRISDIIAYLGKDRQDAERMGVVKESEFTSTVIGDFNAEIINNLTINVIENSLDANSVKIDEEHFSALKLALKENYSLIYNSEKVKRKTDEILSPAMNNLYFKLLKDIDKGDESSPIFTAHINYVNASHYKRDIPYTEYSNDDIVADFIASMTDDYFISLYRHLFKDDENKIYYEDYF